MTSIFVPGFVSGIAVRNRFALAPMMRERCGIDWVCTPTHAGHFGQRANAGLVISDNNRIAANGAASATRSGLHTAA